MSRFLHIGLNYQDVAIRAETIDFALGSIVEDWVRYSPCCWVVWTDKSSQTVMDALKPFITLSQSVLITRIDTNDCAGFLPPWIWEWMRKKLQPPPPLPVPGSAIRAMQASQFPLFPTSLPSATDKTPPSTDQQFNPLGTFPFGPRKPGL